ncbi:MAG TPA: TetR/AcrR family transcriptional regulator [Streptosporangiaceae bacterium]|nr:TetR/AcrR family transcriptional regulator [Streptosporangiaceae bacterium]
MAELSTGQRIHRAALRLFATYGFAGTGIRKIAEEAGINVASLYHYVGTKEDLLERMMNESMTELLAPARDVSQGGAGPAERVRALVDLHVRRHASHAQLCRVGDTELRSLTKARRARIVALRDEYQAIWEDAIATGSAAGEFAVPDVKTATMAVLQMCTGVAYWYSPRGRLSLDEVSDAFVAMATALLRGGTPGDLPDGLAPRSRLRTEVTA